MKRLLQSLPLIFSSSAVTFIFSCRHQQFVTASFIAISNYPIHHTKWSQLTPATSVILRESNDEQKSQWVSETLPEVHSGLRPLDPSDLEIISRCDEKSDCDLDKCIKDPPKVSTRYPFVNMIRVSGSYIANHRNNLSVFHVPGHLLEWNGFPTFLEDMALTWLLGMRIVLVVGCRHQVNTRLAKERKDSLDTRNFPLRITDENTMRIVEEEAGFVRYEVERQLNRCLKLHGGADLSVPGALNANVVSGNFYLAEKIGVVNGVDYQFSGYPTRINVKKIQSIHEQNDVVLLTPCAMSALGERLNVNSESLAVNVATALGANKIIFCSDYGMILRNKSTGETVQNFRLRDAKNILEFNTVKIHQDFFPSFGSQRDSMSTEALDMLLKIAWCSVALEKGVDRAHIVAPSDGALLTELFTATEGSATCITQNEVDEIHPDENFYGSDTDGWMESFRPTSISKPGLWFD